MNLLFRLRTLWRDMTTWISAYLVGRFIIGNYYQVVFSRVYNIPAEFGNLMKFIFGDDVGNQYTQLLSNQIIALRDYIEALVNNDVNAANKEYASLFQIADETARFLYVNNPFWDQNQWRSLINEFLNLNIEEVRAFLTGDYEQSISIFNTLLNYSDVLGDYFMTGLYNYITYQGAPPQPAPTAPANQRKTRG
jgi:hypothetical protein